MTEFSWDTMEEKYSKMREKVMTWAVNKAEDTGGPVPMEVGWLEEEGDGDEEADWWGCEVCYDGGEIGAVHPTT